MSNSKRLTLNDVLLREKRALISGPFGSDISAKFFVQSGIPVIRGNNLTLDARKFIDEGFVFVDEKKAQELDAYAEPNDLIFTAAGTIGQVGMIPQKTKYPRYIISNKQLRARLNPKLIDYQFAYYWVNSPWISQEINNKNTGSTIPLINLSVLGSLPITLPSLPTQHKIASVLSSLDEKIELNNKINAELEAMAKTLYDYWFVQFDFPDENGKPYKSSGGKMMYNATLKREIPVGWEVKSLEGFIATDKNGDWGKEEAEGNYTTKVQCIRGADINGISGMGEIKTPTRFIFKKNESKILVPNDLVIKISGGSPTQSTGRLAGITEEVINVLQIL